MKIELLRRAADRLRPTRIIRDERVMDIRFVMALLLLAAARACVELVDVFGVAALIATGGLALAGLVVWCWRPSGVQSYIPFDHYQWDEQVWPPRPAGPPVLRYRWDGTAAEADTGFDCLRCARRMKRPAHLEVTRCQCGTIYGVAGAGLYARWAVGHKEWKVSP